MKIQFYLIIIVIPKQFDKHNKKLSAPMDQQLTACATSFLSWAIIAMSSQKVLKRKRYLRMCRSQEVLSA